MIRPRKLLVAAVLAIFATGYSLASDIYIAQNAVGADTGADCADAHAVAWFNGAANWGSTAGKIGPGTVVHLCGTFTASSGASEYLKFQGGGISGSPITLVADQGAVTITAPYWSGNVIDLGSNSFITVNGAKNLTIQATANGTGFANQVNGGNCLSASGGSNLLIENLTCSDIYVRTCTPPVSNCTDENDYGLGITASNGNNIQIANNIVHDMHWAIVAGPSGGSIMSNVQFSGNTIYNIDHGAVFSVGSGGSGTLTGGYIYANTISGLNNWDDPLDQNHHDPVHVFDFANGVMSQIYIYNNYIFGDWGLNDNAGIYVESADEGGMITSCGIFNNILNQTAGNNASGAIADYTNTGCLQANNTIFADPLATEFTSSGGSTIYNNIGITQGRVIEAGDGGKITASDYNDWYNSQGGNQFIPPNGYCCLANLPAWVSATGFDAHSIASNPNLLSNFRPGTGSPVIQAGTNLNLICSGQPNPGLGALCEDFVGFPRSPSAKWDIGAYAYVAPASPDNLTNVVH